MVMFDIYKLGLQLYKKCALTDLIIIVTNCNFKWVTIKLIILCAKSVTKTTQWVSSNFKFLSVVDHLVEFEFGLPLYMFVRFDSVGSPHFDLHVVAYDTAHYYVSLVHNGLFVNIP